MLVGFLTSLDFCTEHVMVPISAAVWLTSRPHPLTPQLISSSFLVSFSLERPDIASSSIRSTRVWLVSEVYGSTRFLELSFSSCPSSSQWLTSFRLASQVASSSVSGLHRICTVWRNGIFWRNLDKITTVIELLDNNRCVLVAMSYDVTSLVE